MTPPFAVADPPPAEPRPVTLSGIPSIDRALSNPHPVVERYRRGEATEAELLSVPGMNQVSAVTIDELLTWLEGPGPACAPTR